MELKYERNKDGILASMFPIYEWWAFGNLYGRVSWGDWAIKNASKVQVHFNRKDGESENAELHIFGDFKEVKPLIKDASLYFNVSYKCKVEFFDAFTETTKQGICYTLSVRQ